MEPPLLPLGAEKSSLEPLLGGPRRISRQVSAILEVKRLPRGSPRGSKMGSKIESGLKVAKSQKSQYLSHENLICKGPGSPKSDPKPVQNWFQIASSTRRPSESLWRASWSALGGLRSRKKNWERLLGGLGPKRVPKLGAQIGPKRSKMPLRAQEAPRRCRGAIFDQL